ncbi:MAG TPA: hypothetical protein VFX59_27985 [Polyangiales bacterium]|nr:hypothetical protein [Polyangiales bacterium]
MRKIALFLLALLACGDEDAFMPMDVVDSTCAEALCGWNKEQGELAASASWHEHQRAVELTGTPALVSKTYAFVQNIDCLSFSFLADIAPDAQLALELDFNDDKRVDTSAPVPAVRWRRFEVALRAPPEYRALRIALRKQGPGTVRIASLVIDSKLESCSTVGPTKLADGSMCSTDLTCASSRCVLGQCASCAAGGCGEGDACRSSDECRDGACAAGVCRACAKQGACAVNQGCSIGGQCASGSCSFGTQPGLTRYPGADGVCGDCASDAACGGGYCVLGRCSACRDDADCEGGQVCRYTDAFDVSTRTCMPRITSTVPRGGLCESAADCADGLACGAVEGRAKRCGFACLADTECGSGAVCATSGATRHVDAPATLAILPEWSTAPGRIATCYRTSSNACEVQEQCKSVVISGFTVDADLACCGGKCAQATLNPVDNTCVGGSQLPN